MTTTMVQLLQVYKCGVCGNVVELVNAGGGKLVCCNQPMLLMNENTVDASREKHIPVIEATETGVIVRVGSIDHPMEEKHYIEWIEVIADGKTYRQFLQPGDAPQADFAVKSENIVARAYCNLHGLWKGESV